MGSRDRKGPKSRGAIARIPSVPRRPQSKNRRVTKGQLQVPFRERDLLTTDAFIRYCNDYGIKTDRDELEYFEKDALLLPAIRVFLGVAEFKRVLAGVTGGGKQEWRYIPKEVARKAMSRRRGHKVDRRTYYSYGTLILGKPGWLKRYRRMGLVSVPCKE